MILVFGDDYSTAVLAGAVSSLDELPAPRIADPTDIDELRLYFLMPEHHPNVWRGKRPAAIRGTTMLRERTTHGVNHCASDGAEYFEKAPVVFRDADTGEVTLVKRSPWLRTTEKLVAPGYARRSRLREERVAELGT